MISQRWAVIIAVLVLTAACGSTTTDAEAGAGPTSSLAAPASTLVATPTTTPAVTTPTTAPDQTTTAPVAVGPIPANPAYEVESTTDLVYASGAVRDGEVELMANLFVPVDAPGPHPVYIHFPGGGFQFADADNSGPAPALAARGFVALSVDYRVQGDDPIPSTRVGGIYDAVGGTEGGGLARAIAAAVEDGLAGMDWLLEQADDLDLDTERVVIGGGSAGAINANHIAYTANDFAFERPAVAATVDLWGGFTLAKPSDAVSGEEPPVFIVHGTNDNVVSYTFTEDFVAAAESVGLPYELYPVEGAGHGVDIVNTDADDGTAIFDHLVRWLRETLYGDA